MQQTQEPTKTDSILAGMLGENTGRHILDSGGAYGRHWERNAGMAVHDWKDRPDATIDNWGAVELDLFHYLTRRLEFMPDADKAWRQWSEEPWRAREPYFPLMQEYAEVTGVETPDSFNSYNGDSLLSQVIQGVVIYLPGDEEGSPTGILLQIHGGADVRGGYTAPRVFRVLDSEYMNPATVLLAQCSDVQLSAGDQHASIYGPDFDGDNWFDGEPPVFYGDNAFPWDEVREAFIAPNGEPVEVFAPEPIC